MAVVGYTILVHNEFENQEIHIDPINVGGVVAEADMDAAAQAFAQTLISGTAAPYPLTLDYVKKTTTTSTQTTLG